MNSEAQEFWPKSNASGIARVRTNDLANNDREGPLGELYLIASY